MSRSCFDSITAADIPAGSELVAGYIDGRYAWSEADWARFPDRIKVRIAVFASTNNGHVLDVEPGDATPTQAVDWVRMRRAAGADPTVYTGIRDWDAVREAFLGIGEPEPHYWIAHYDGDATLLAGAVAKQWGNPLFTGGHYDTSIVADFWPGVDKDEDIEAVALYAKIAPLLQERIVAPQFDTNVAIKEALAKLATQVDDAEVRAVIEAQLGVLADYLKPRPKEGRTP